MTDRSGSDLQTALQSGAWHSRVTSTWFTDAAAPKCLGPTPSLILRVRKRKTLFNGSESCWMFELCYLVLIKTENIFIHYSLIISSDSHLAKMIHANSLTISASDLYRVTYFRSRKCLRSHKCRTHTLMSSPAARVMTKRHITRSKHFYCSLMTLTY